MKGDMENIWNVTKMTSEIVDDQETVFIRDAYLKNEEIWERIVPLIEKITPILHENKFLSERK